MFPRRLAHCANSALRLPSVTAIVQSPHAPSTSYPIARIHTRSTPLAQTAQAATASSSSAPSLAYTLPPKPSSDVAPYQRSTKRTWHLFDAKDQVVGRMAGRIAHLLVGKHKPDYDPAHDDGDFVVVLNAKHLKFTGKKWEQKLYRYHTGYVGGLKEIPAERWRQSHPDRILKHAVAGMIHKNKLKVPRLNRLKIYSGLVHPHSAQFPFDVIQQVPALKAARDAELAELAAKEQFEKDAINMTTSGGKSKKENASSTEPSSDIQGPDDGTVPNDPDIKKAILKDREERKGKPSVHKEAARMRRITNLPPCSGLMHQVRTEREFDSLAHD